MEATTRQARGREHRARTIEACAGARESYEKRLRRVLDIEGSLSHGVKPFLAPSFVGPHGVTPSISRSGPSVSAALALRPLRELRSI